MVESLKGGIERRIMPNCGETYSWLKGWGRSKSHPREAQYSCGESPSDLCHTCLLACQKSNTFWLKELEKDPARKGEDNDRT